MQLYGIIGHPVEHSISPEMQTAAFRVAGIDAGYELIPAAPENLAAETARLRTAGYAGWNVTVPHKESIIPLLDSIDGEAVAAGSVNTVINRNGRLEGYTTDGYGLETACIESFGTGFRDSVTAFIGAGGAARAAAVYAARRGARGIILINRTPARAEALAETVRAAAPQIKITIMALEDETGIARSCSKASLLIQCTSLGLKKDDPAPLNPALLPPTLPVMDMVYGKTKFLELAAACGNPVADGLGMLLHQGAAAFTLWTGLPAPLDAMRRAISKEIRQ